MTLSLEVPDMLDRLEVAVTWDDYIMPLTESVRASFGLELDEAFLDEDEIVIPCQGAGPLGLPFSFRFHLGILAERFAQSLLDLPQISARGYRLVGGSITTDHDGTIRVYLEGRVKS